MNFITLSWYIETVREYSKNRGKSYQKILGDLFEIITHNGKEYPVESATSSRIMNGEYDVPYEIREAYNGQSEESKKNISDEFIEKTIDSASMDGLVAKIKERISLSDISEQTKNTVLDEKNPLIVLSFALSRAIISSNRKTLNKNLYKDNNASIDLISGDLIAIGFNKKIAISNRIVVVPVDDKFTMIFKDSNGDEVIGKDSIHGKWLMRLHKAGIDKPKIKFVKQDEKMKMGKCTIGKTEFYLLPVSSLKERYTAQSSIDFINKSLNCLAFEYNVSGQGVPIYVPLIGTGRSRVHLSPSGSISLIKKAFLENKNGFFGDVKIVVYKKNIDDWGNFDGL